jgi:hypothetical protein
MGLEQSVGGLVTLISGKKQNEQTSPQSESPLTSRRGESSSQAAARLRPSSELSNKSEVLLN